MAAFSVCLTLCCTSALAGEKDKMPSDGGGWGSVSGRVVFEGDLKDPALKPYGGTILVFEPRFMKEERNRPGPPKVIAKVPNEQLLIDPESRGVKNAFVYLAKKPERVHPALAAPALAPVELVAHERKFAPRAFTLRVGQPLRMKSLGEGANFNGEFVSNPPQNFLVPAKGIHDWTADRPERIPVRFTNAIERSAVSYGMVTDHPYATITGADGLFRLENLPEGEHELKIWHETTGWVRKGVKIEVIAGKTLQLDPFKITRAQLSVAGIGVPDQKIETPARAHAPTGSAAARKSGK